MILILLLQFAMEANPIFFSVASRAETHANRSSLTTSASEGMLSPHPGACRPNKDWAKTFAALQASIVLHRRNHAAATRPRRRGLTPPLRWIGQQGTEQSPPTICPQPQQPKPPSGLCHLAGELRVGPLFRPPCCCQRHPCSCSSARSCSAISSDSRHECRVDG